MYSGEQPNSDQVIADLGEAFINAFVDAVDGSRSDYVELRSPYGNSAVGRAT